MTREELREEWERRIADFKASGMTRVQWCKEHGESIYKLKYWLYKIERQKRNEINKTNWVSMIVRMNQRQIHRILYKLKLAKPSLKSNLTLIQRYWKKW